VNAAAFAVNLAAALGVVLAVMLGAFAVSLRTGKHRGVDVAWGLAFAAVALTGYPLSAGHGDEARRALATSLVAVWGLRLAAHLAHRSRGAAEDPRYARMLARVPPERRTRYALRIVYLLQAGLVWFVSLPVQAAQYLPQPLGPLTAAAVALWLVGIGFEAIGDRQLARFKADPANRGRVLDRGLWRYTRHPNYFGDACVWWGLFLLVADQPIGWAFLPAPLLITWLLVYGSGKPLVERQLAANKPGWADYAARTSGFLPRPPRRPPAGPQPHRTGSTDPP
jgi:steroid 5-alpha reductase family enzyme